MLTLDHHTPPQYTREIQTKHVPRRRIPLTPSSLPFSIGNFSLSLDVDALASVVVVQLRCFPLLLVGVAFTLIARSSDDLESGDADALAAAPATTTDDDDDDDDDDDAGMLLSRPLACITSN